MRQAVSIEMIGHVSEILVRLLVGIVVTLGLKNTLTVLKTASKDDLRTSFGHRIIG